MLAKSDDGHGGEELYRQLSGEPDNEKLMQIFLDRDRNHTVPDQWQAQILVRILRRASVVYVSDAPDDTVRNMHMIPAHSIGEALAVAKRLLDNDAPTVTAIPDGIAVMVVEE